MKALPLSAYWYVICQSASHYSFIYLLLSLISAFEPAIAQANKKGPDNRAFVNRSIRGCLNQSPKYGKSPALVIRMRSIATSRRLNTVSEGAKRIAAVLAS